MNNSFYFSHDGNARGDPKILELRSVHGWEGYGVYWLLIESMFENAETKLKHKGIHAFSLANNIDESLLKNIIETCISEELFESDGEYFWSNGLAKRKDYVAELREKRSAGGKKGMKTRWKKEEELEEESEELDESDNSLITDLEQCDNSLITIKRNNIKLNEMKPNKKESILKQVVDYLNEQTGGNFKTSTEVTIKAIRARMAEGFTLDDFKKVIDNKCRDWKNDPEYARFLRPVTLFGNKFEGYLNQESAVKSKTQNVMTGGCKI